MKKIYSLILVIIIILLGVIIYLNYGRTEADSFYVIKEAKGYILKDEAKLRIDIYSKLEKSLISYTDKNIYQIKNETEVYNLENVNITVSKVNDFYVNMLEADLIESSSNLIIDNAILFIKNESYQVSIDIGYISILNPLGYELLSFDNYYGSYSYINGELKLVGINLELTDKYNYLSDFSVSGFSKGKLDDIKFNLYGNEVDIKAIIPNYNPLYLKEKEIKLEGKKLFIPLAYKDLLMIKESYITLNLDGVLFYIDHFSYISNVLDYNDYTLEEGEISYVKS